ncbi:MAG: hypothetical protein K2N85_11145 [Lachnospiraceae bacterium]|nr:hypothetical protein [Lachnospiraceae bacterium]
MEKTDMRKRRVGNYLKAYPHVYEVFQRAISMQNIGMVLFIIHLAVFTFGTLFFWLIEENDWCGLLGMILYISVFVAAFYLTHVWLKTGVISLEELELMEKDLAGEKELVMNWGYSTDESFIIGFHRIPRKGLNSVYMGYRIQEGCRYYSDGVHMYYCELVFYYDDGTYISAELLRVPRDSDEKDLMQLIHRYDDSVKIYRHKNMNENMPLFCPFKKLRAEVPSVRKETVDKLDILSNGNRFWRMRANSRDKWDGNKEVELKLYGTTLTWLVYFVWLCLSVYLFFYIGVLSEAAALLVPVIAGVFYYLFFVINAGKITDKAIDIFYRDLCRNSDE